MNNKVNVALSCAFCGNKFQPEEEFRNHYKLMAWCDDPDNPESPNKLAKCVHTKCLDRFIELNINLIVNFIINRLATDNLTNDNIS